MDREEVVFLAAAAVDVGVALLETDDVEALLQAGESEGEEFFLGFVGVSGELAGDVESCTAGDEGEYGGGDKLVGEDEVGGLDGFEGGGGEEVRVPGAGANELDAAAAGREVEVGGEGEGAIVVRRGGIGLED